MIQLDFFRRLLFGPPPPRARAPAPARNPEPVSAAPLQSRARALLGSLGVPDLAARVKVSWSPRLRSTAGLAYPAQSLIALNPRLQAFGPEEVDRTLLHELAHLLAYHRAGRRIAPHGPQWRQACLDLGLRDETRCHTLPLPRRRLARRHLYRCPGCGLEVHRVRPIQSRSACLACCRTHNGGHYDERFRLRKERVKS